MDKKEFVYVSPDIKVWDIKPNVAVMSGDLEDDGDDC